MVMPVIMQKTLRAFVPWVPVMSRADVAVFGSSHIHKLVHICRAAWQIWCLRDAKDSRCSAQLGARSVVRNEARASHRNWGARIV